MTRIQHINVWPACKFGFLIFGTLGLVAGALCSAMAFAGVGFPHHPTLVGGLAVIPLIVCPVAWGSVGAIGATLVCLLFNLSASLFGGLEVNIG